MKRGTCTTASFTLILAAMAKPDNLAMVEVTGANVESEIKLTGTRATYGLATSMTDSA